MKTPEEMAEEYCEDHDECEFARDAFLAGYQAAKELYAAKLKEANDTIDGMVDECEGLKTIIYDNEQNNLPTSAKWISVKDRLPEEGEDVLVFGQYLNDIPKVLGVRACYRGNQEWKYIWEGSYEWIYRENDVTHWMELPAPPKEEK